MHVKLIYDDTKLVLLDMNFKNTLPLIKLQGFSSLSAILELQLFIQNQQITANRAQSKTARRLSSKDGGYWGEHI